MGLFIDQAHLTRIELIIYTKTLTSKIQGSFFTMAQNIDKRLCRKKKQTDKEHRKSKDTKCESRQMIFKQFSSQQPDKKSKLKYPLCEKIKMIHLGFGIRRKIKKNEYDNKTRM